MQNASMKFNWDDYWADVRNGVSSKKILKKHKTGAYMTKPIFTKKIPKAFQ